MMCIAWAHRGASVSRPVEIADQAVAVGIAAGHAQAMLEDAIARRDARAIAECRLQIEHLTAALTTLRWIARSRAGAIELFTLARTEKSNGRPTHD